MSAGEGQTRSIRARLVAVAALATLCLGTWGFAIYEPTAALIDDFYRALQLFVLESGNMAGALPWQLDIARLAAPALTVASAVFVVAAASRDQVDRWRAHRRRGHVVVCGLGRRGSAAALALHRAGHQVVGVELDPDGSGTLRCRQAGIPVVIGDARDPIVLANAGVQAADHLVLLTPVLEFGGEVALAAIGLVGERPGSPLVIHLEIDHPELAALLRAMTVSEHDAPSWRLEELDLSGVAARAMLDACEPWTPGSSQAHVLVVGRNGLATAVGAQLNRRWRRHDGREGGLTLTALGPDPATWVLPSRPANAAYVCIDDEAAALTAGLALARRQPDLPVVVRIEKALALADVLRRDAPNLHAFSLDLAVLTPSVVLDSTVERIARALHDTYRRNAGADDPSAVPWERLPEQLRASNRAQAAHVAHKVRVSGRVLVPDDGEPPDSFTDDEIDVLGRLEHKRWTEERLAAGWTPGPRDTAAKTTPYLVPWETLDESVREVDRGFVRALPDVLRDAGLVLRRTSPMNGRPKRLAA